MVKTGRLASAARAGFTLGIAILGLVSSAGGITTSDKPAAVLVWPKIVVDTSATLESRKTDTVLQLGNSNSKDPKRAHCFYVNANSHCAETAAEPGKVCGSSTDCPLAGNASAFAPCVPGWTEIDFDIRITPDQPLAWRASKGLSRKDFPITSTGVCQGGGLNGQPCTFDPSSPTGGVGCGAGVCVQAPSNAGSGIPPTPEDPFVGSLKCIQFDTRDDVPDQSNVPGDLIGSAAIESGDETSGVDVARYNAIGIPFIAPVSDAAHPAGSVVLDDTQYGACPATLVLNQIFDNAPDPLSISTDAAPTVTTDLTLVPCGDDFLRQEPGEATAQYLVFNEFEQRLSTSRKVDCFFESRMSLIDTGNPSRSIFSFNVQGTLVGQTRIRGVGSAATGHGLLGVARGFFGKSSSVAYNLQQIPSRAGTDIITIP
ncbi:MAG TPA: hypothetical protein VMW56_01645 [Candidatus Margulisiibacteriota bacterium]|nr:hypothetical protein [Candidatus Margulisiibacteriota bacterium]